MSDFLTKEARSSLMSRIRGKNTGIERAVFRLLRGSGIPFKRHLRALPGCPDVVIPTAKLVIFLDGDFWHGRRFESWRRKLKPFWVKKIRSNIARDKSNRRMLRKLGWSVLRIWGSEVHRRPQVCLDKILKLAGLEPPHSRLVLEGPTRHH